MTLSFLVAVFLPYLAMLPLSFAMEGVLTPRPRAPWHRPVGALAIHAGLLLIVYGLELILFRRPIFAAANVLSIQFVLVLVSHAKYQALREPFVYPDVEYFTDAVRHPRLYLPFFGRMKAAGAVAAYGAVLWAGLTLETSMTATDGLWPRAMTVWLGTSVSDWVIVVTFLVAAAGLAVVGGGLARLGARAGEGLPVSFDASADLVRLGFLAALWRYAEEERRDIASTTGAGASPYVADPGRSESDGESGMPDLVVIQSESFFDARRSFNNVRGDVLRSFDTLRAQSSQFGTLKVAAWGANTVRTEFAFLSGRNPATLGIHRFNPYRRLARQGVATIASTLQARGYRTICVHPYPESFYTRHLVYPKMGFDTFLDIRAFENRGSVEQAGEGAAKDSGPYVSDACVARKIRALLADSERDDRPLFIFVITMENHGPLHWESVGPHDVDVLFDGAVDPAARDLVAYVRHLKNADAMFSDVKAALSASNRPGGLCIYGDHVPIMPAVYELMGEPTGLTDYLIWRSDDVSPNHTHIDDLPVHQLGAAFLRLTNATPSPRTA